MEYGRVKTPRLAAGVIGTLGLAGALTFLLGLGCQTNPAGRAPLIPAVPSGLSSGYPNRQYQFSTRTEDPDGDSVSCQFDWGDSTRSEWSAFVPNDTWVLMFKSWTDSGSYSIRARARDADSNVTDWSAGHAFAIQDSQSSRPSVPATPAGNSTTVAFRPETYGTQSVDPDSARISYVFNWGDGSEDTTGFFNSGEPGSATHAWQQSGSYAVRALALTEDARQSIDWSDSIVVRVFPSRPARK